MHTLAPLLPIIIIIIIIIIITIYYYYYYYYYYYLQPEKVLGTEVVLFRLDK